MQEVRRYRWAGGRASAAATEREATDLSTTSEDVASDRPEEADQPGPAELTIDELARETGVTVRNIRAYQSRGLLPAPVVRARTGFYGADHRTRLELIQELTAEGVKLDTVKKLFDTTGGDTAQVASFIHTVRHLFGEESRAIVAVEELAERFQTEDVTLLRKARKLGLLRKVSDDQYEEVSPRLVSAGEALVGLGISPERGLEMVGALRHHADGIARLYVDLFVSQVWKPFDESGRPDEGWDRIHETLGEMRKVAGDALLAVLEVAVSHRLDVTFGRDITRTVRTPRDERSRDDG